MKNADIVKAWSDTFFSGDTATSASYMADDFKFTGPVPEPLNKDGYMGIMLTLVKAFPNLDNNLEITGETEDTVSGTVQMAGTHRGDLDLSPMNGPVIPPTGKSFRNPRESFVCTIKNGKISKFDVDVPPGGGLDGILTQLGVGMP